MGDPGHRLENLLFQRHRLELEDPAVVRNGVAPGDRLRRQNVVSRQYGPAEGLVVRRRVRNLGPARSQPPVDVTFKEISSGGTVAGGPFLLAIDTAGYEWQWTTGQTAWQQIPGVTPGYGKSIAAGPDRTVFLVDTLQGQLWKWKAGEDSNWVLLDSTTGFVQVSARADGSLLAVHGSGGIYEGLKSYPSLKGFRGSDWNNAGTKIFAVRYEAGVDRIYRSADGITFETSPCGTLPQFTPDNPYFWYALPLFIPTAKFGDATEKMLISPIGSQKIYRCNDISQASLTFTAVHTDTVNAGTGGIFNGFAEDADRNVYAGWWPTDGRWARWLGTTWMP